MKVFYFSLYHYPSFLAGWLPDWMPYSPKALKSLLRLLLIPKLNVYLSIISRLPIKYLSYPSGFPHTLPKVMPFGHYTHPY